MNSPALIDCAKVLALNYGDYDLTQKAIYILNENAGFYEGERQSAIEVAARILAGELIRFEQMRPRTALELSEANDKLNTELAEMKRELTNYKLGFAKQTEALENTESFLEKAHDEVARLTKDRDDWKQKHWKVHDDFHRQFIEMEAIRVRMADIEHERDVALVNEREMREALRKQNDNYNHLTSKIDSWKDCIEAAQNRERAALAERDGADHACQKWKDSYELVAREVENQRQQVASATAMVSTLRSEKMQLEDARRGDLRCIIGITANNQRMVVALSDVLNVFKDDLAVTDLAVVTNERRDAWKNALEIWEQYKLDHP